MEDSLLGSQSSLFGMDTEGIKILYEYALESQANCMHIRKELMREMHANQVLRAEVEALKRQLHCVEALLQGDNSSRRETNQDALPTSTRINANATNEDFQATVEKLQEKLVEKTFKIIEVNTKLANIEQKKKMKKTKKRIIEQLKKKKDFEKSHRNEVKNTNNVEEVRGGSRKLGRFEIKSLPSECTQCLQNFNSNAEREKSSCYYHSCKPVLLETNVGKMYYWRCCSYAQFNSKTTKFGCQQGKHKLLTEEV